MGKLGPKDRLSVVTYENGPQGVIRKTPFLAVGREGSGRQRFFDLLDTIAEDGRGTVGDERFLTPLHREEKSDVVAAVNVGKFEGLVISFCWYVVTLGLIAVEVFFQQLWMLFYKERPVTLLQGLLLSAIQSIV